MRTQEQILQDMAASHKAYFDHLSDHTAFMQTLSKLHALERELICAYLPYFLFSRRST